MTKPDEFSLISRVETEVAFRPLADFFKTKAVDELLEAGGTTAETDPKTANLLDLVFGQLVERCHGAVRALSESPIEQVFLRSLMLQFLRNSQALVFMPPFRNTSADLREWVRQIRNLEQFLRWYEERHGTRHVADEFLDEQVRSGRMPIDELPLVRELLVLYELLPLRAAWHVALQSRFPALMTERGTARVDILLWVPVSRSLKIVVECDGFSGHRFARSFVRDRKRDRALKKLGFEVMRFSGAEINNDPREVASDLFDYLVKREPPSRIV